MKIPFNDLHLGDDRAAVLTAIKQVLDSGQFILGKWVRDFETHFASACESTYGVGVNSGTDALTLILQAVGVHGMEVILPAMTSPFTAIAVRMAGGTPVFVDVEPDTLNIDPHRIEEVISQDTKVILPVHLYGMPAQMDAIRSIAEHYHLEIVEDCCQAHGAWFRQEHVGTMGVAGAFSFYPTKNLGALGDAGMIVTRWPWLERRVRVLRDGGRKTRDWAELRGMNSRMDELQAAILMARTLFFNTWTKRRAELAARYHEAFWAVRGRIVPPPEHPGRVWHLYVVKVMDGKREALRSWLAERDIETLVHYPTIVPEHPVFLPFVRNSDLPEALAAAERILSLPLYPSMTDAQQDYVIEAVLDFVKS